VKIDDLVMHKRTDNLSGTLTFAFQGKHQQHAEFSNNHIHDNKDVETINTCTK